MRYRFLGSIKRGKGPSEVSVACDLEGVQEDNVEYFFFYIVKRCRQHQRLSWPV